MSQSHEPKPAGAESRRRHPRVPIDARIEFIVDADLIEAQGINLSDGGIAMLLPESIPVLLRYKMDGETIERAARVVHAQRQESGFKLALEFRDSDD